MTRGVSIRRQAVLDLIKTQSSPMQSKAMARMLKVKEISVRAAITWLVLGGYIRKHGYVKQVTVYDKRPKYTTRTVVSKIALYQWTGKEEPISHLRIKGTDRPDREAMMMNYGDGGLALQKIMQEMCLMAPR